MRVKNLVVGLIIIILGMTLLLAVLWNGLTFQEKSYEVTANQPSVTECLSVGDKIMLNCYSGAACKGILKLLGSNLSVSIVGGQAVTIPESGNYSLDCLNGNCVFKIKLASSLTLAVRYAISGLGIIALIFAVMLFKVSVYSRPGRNFILVGKHIECRAKTLRKHVCVIKPAKNVENLFDIVLDYFINGLNLKVVNKKKSFVLLKGKIGSFWKGDVSVTAYQLKDGSIEAEFTFPGITAEGTIDLERLSKKFIDLDKKLSRYK